MYSQTLRFAATGSRLVKRIAASVLTGAALGFTLHAETFAESPHTFTEESVEYAEDLRIGDGATPMFVTNNMTAITLASGKNFNVGASASGDGTYVQNGGSLDVAGGDLLMGRESGAKGCFELNGGTVRPRSR